jgi:hypothetical protein
MHFLPLKFGTAPRWRRAALCPNWSHDSDFITEQYRARKQEAARSVGRLLTRAALEQRGFALCPNLVKFRLYHEQNRARKQEAACLRAQRCILT